MIGKRYESPEGPFITLEPVAGYALGVRSGEKFEVVEVLEN